MPERDEEDRVPKLIRGSVAIAAVALLFGGGWLLGQAARPTVVRPATSTALARATSSSVSVPVPNAPGIVAVPGLAGPPKNTRVAVSTQTTGVAPSPQTPTRTVTQTPAATVNQTPVIHPTTTPPVTHPTTTPKPTSTQPSGGGGGVNTG